MPTLDATARRSASPRQQIALELWWVSTTISSAYVWQGGDGHIHVVDPEIPDYHDTVLRGAASIRQPGRHARPFGTA